MADSVRPRISKKIYELVKMSASASCVPDSHWLVEAIKEKAAREGFEIVDATVIHIPNNTVGFSKNHSHNISSAPEEY